ncbi:2-polyprenyl-6-methoxyphenol hydroxylase [Actinosynnema sp. ALI-1.44]|nr:2-polyprenyl-6-methoxyphenol hydroxylase [Actinosynnema sp. ALI-1.44]
MIVVGGGPAGLLLAGELRLAGADPLILEANDEVTRRQRSLGLRGINTRTVQTLRLRGLVDELAHAQWAMLERFAAEHAPAAADRSAGLARVLAENRARGHFSGLTLTDDDPAPRGTVTNLVLKQHELERILADWAVGLGVRIRTGCEVVDVVAEEEAVRAVLADGEQVRAAYLVGCDGGRSTVRKRAGFRFPGTDATMTGRSAVAELADPDAVASAMHGRGGLLDRALVPGEISTVEFDGGPADRDAPVTAAEMQASIRRVSGVAATVTKLDVGIRFSDNTRQADTYRRGRVLVAGDAAHVHSPIGGQGLNLGLQDATNLGWKLGLVVRGLAPDSLLDSYTAERHPVGARVLRNTRAQVALMRPGPQVAALREVMAETLAIPAAKRHFIDLANGTDIDYAPAAAHPAIGRFVPPLTLPDNELLRDGTAVLVDLVGSSRIRAIANGHTDRVRVVRAQHSSRSDLTALLVRPDGYVAWAASDNGTAGLPEALTDWFGRSTSLRSPSRG